MPVLGLIKRRQVWFPTLKGWVILGVAFAGTFAGLVFGLVDFLGPAKPIPSKILVVEGWLPDYALEEAKQTFDRQGYQTLVTTGVPIEQGFYICDQTNYAQFAMATFKALGVPPTKLVPVVCAAVPRNRTYATARAVYRWLEQQTNMPSVDVFTLGVHARRTWLLYQTALGSNYQVGIIPGDDKRFSRTGWWTTSSGFRTVTSEAIAYLYAKFLFFPTSYEAQDTEPH